MADVSVDLRGIFADGDTVVVEETMHATLGHGGHYENDYAGWFAAPQAAP